MKQLLVVLSVSLLAGVVQAKNLQFVLKCSSGSASKASYQVVKTASKKAGKWENSFSILVLEKNADKPVSYDLTEASGDEGYLVYTVAQEGSGVSDWVKIGNGFTWAVFSTDDGDFECK